VRVLHLEAGRNLYGGARQVGYLVRALAARGIDNLLVLDQGHALGDLGADGAAKVIEWPLAAGDLDLPLSARLRRLIRAERPDVVHVHSRRGADTFGGRAARAAGVPAILTRRVQSAEPGVWLRFKCRPYGAIVAISRAVHDELAGLGIAAGRLRLIPSAVDTALFRPEPAARVRLTARYGLPETAFIAGAAAQLIPRKNLDRLLHLLHLLHLVPDTGLLDFRLLVFGQGPERARLGREAARLGIERRVVFCGFEPDWPELVPGLDLLLHPARREGLGAVVLEAMSAGVAVVAAAAGGIVDAIDDGVDGCLVGADTAEDWRNAVLGLAGDPDRRLELAAAARRKVEARFTIERMTDAYVALYREVSDRAAERRRSG